VVLLDNLVEGIFLKRLNRFLGNVKIKNKLYLVHIPNPGRMNEILVPGVKVYLQYTDKNFRKTQYDLIGIEINNVQISIDSNLPNRIFIEGINTKKIRNFGEIVEYKKEIQVQDSRIDFLLKNRYNEIFVEVKSCTLVEDMIAKFPDAPTKRGVRHLNTLNNLVKKGYRGAIVFIIQREDTKIFMPNDETDPDFGNKLREVVENGVEIYSYRCKINFPKIEIDKSVEIKLQ